MVHPGWEGVGKTEACSRFVHEHVTGPPCLAGGAPHWINIIAPTLGDAVTACFEGPSGIRAYSPDARLKVDPGGTVIRWPNGSRAKLFGVNSKDDVERLRAGGNVCFAWLEEIAAWRHLDDGWDQMRLGLRAGNTPRWIGSTTPKPRPLIKRLARGLERNVIVTHATTDDNPHLPAHIREMLYDRYDGTSLGAQELLGRVIDEDLNALWTREGIEANRVSEDEAAGLVQRVEVGVDPSGGAGEQGIVVDGMRKWQEVIPDDKRTPGGPARRLRKMGFVLADYTVHLPPDGWGRRAVEAAIDYEADAIVVEVNFGGDMAAATIQTALDRMGVSVPVKQVRASRGKVARAEPVSALGAQGRWKWAGTFEELEDQCCTWTSEVGYSPDRLDAMVWPPWNMGLVSVLGRGVGMFGGSNAAVDGGQRGAGGGGMSTVIT